MTDTDTTPAYVGLCPECHGTIAAAVAADLEARES